MKQRHSRDSKTVIYKIVGLLKRAENEDYYHWRSNFDLFKLMA